MENGHRIDVVLERNEKGTSWIVLERLLNWCPFCMVSVLRKGRKGENGHQMDVVFEENEKGTS